MLRDRQQRWVKVVPLEEAVAALAEAGVPFPRSVIRRNLTVCVRLDGQPFVEWEEVVGRAAAWGLDVAEKARRRLQEHVLEMDIIAYHIMRWKEHRARMDARREQEAWRWVPKPIEIEFDEWLQYLLP